MLSDWMDSDGELILRGCEAKKNPAASFTMWAYGGAAPRWDEATWAATMYSYIVIIPAKLQHAS